MGLDSKYGDPDIKKKGKWFDIRGEETRVKIRHIGNPDWQKYMLQHQDVFPSGQGRGVIQRNGSAPKVDEERANEVINRGLAEHVLVDWKKLSFDEEEMAEKFGKSSGEYVGYSTENAEKLLDLLPPFRAEVFQMAREEQAFREEEMEEDTKN